MPAFLDNPPLMHEQDAIGLNDRGKSMRHNENGSLGRGLLHRLLHQLKLNHSTILRYMTMIRLDYYQT